MGSRYDLLELGGYDLLTVMHDARRRASSAEEPELPPNLFVVGLLHDLKAGKYSARAWAAFWRNSWVRSAQIIQEHAELRSSWIRFTTAGAVFIVVAASAVLRFAPPQEALVFLLTSLLWWAVLMADLGLHLGLIVNLESGELEESLGWPNRLTELRGFAAVWVVWGAHWSTRGIYWPLLLVFGLAAVTDLLDGWLARRGHVSTRWGRLYDPFIDGIFFSTAAVALAVIGVLPEWLAVVVIFRFAFPVIGAIAFLFVRGRTLRVRHTTWGRLSSGSIAVTVFLAGASSALQLPFSVIAPGVYAAVFVASVGALVTILMKGIEQV